jgi:hypothetical protein
MHWRVIACISRAFPHPNTNARSVALMERRKTIRNSEL